VDLPTVWFILLGVFLVGYAVLDGFDLGVGILHLFAGGDAERRTLMDSIGPFWHGNEVWLVVFGGALFAAFPAAYAAAFTALYLPFMALLVALIFRAVAIEFRHHTRTPAGRLAWDVAFGAASLLTAFIFGVAVGNALGGVPLGPEGTVEWGPLDFLRPYPVLVGCFAVVTFAMHGAIYLQLRTTGKLRRRAERWAWRAYGLFVVLYLLTTAVTLIEFPGVAANFRAHPWLWVVPALNALAVANLPRSLYYDRPAWAFASSMATIAAFTFLFGAGLYPNLIASTRGAEYDLTVWKAAASQGALENLLVAVAIGLPFVLSYVAVTYWVFRKPSPAGEYGGHEAADLSAAPPGPRAEDRVVAR
jgi:cytochrome d ubiquinol oxidase subunit II